MRIKRTILALACVLTVSFLWNLQVGAYVVFTAEPPESGKCSQCHTDWPGATHDAHNGFNCSLCHSGADPVASSSCSGCHGGAGAILGLHSPLEGPADQSYCGYCHEAVPAEDPNWGEIKAMFR